MKKMQKIIIVALILFLITIATKIYAASLDNLNITTDKQTVHPSGDVTVNIQFRQELGSYTFDIAYDNNLFDFVSAEGGTHDDNGTRIRVYYYDQTGGTAPRTSMSVTFRAKAGITTSNPTSFLITAEGLANADASIVYDDITTPIVKDIIVEPEYSDYNIELRYTGDIIKEVKKDMKIVISSEMGRNYEHTRLIAQAETPEGATAKLLATDAQTLEHDIIQSGWGDAQGDPIGGANVVKELDVQGLFDKAGQYTITLELIDRDNSDYVIANSRIVLAVEDSVIQDNNNETPEQNNTTIQTPAQNNKNTVNQPTTLPKTGNTIYTVIIPIIITLVCCYILLRKKENN